MLAYSGKLLATSEMTSALATPDSSASGRTFTKASKCTGSRHVHDHSEMG